MSLPYTVHVLAFSRLYGLPRSPSLARHGAPPVSKLRSTDPEQSLVDLIEFDTSLDCICPSTGPVKMYLNENAIGELREFESGLGPRFPVLLLS